MNMSKFRGFVFLTGLIAVWWALTYFEVYSPLLLPSPLDVLERLRKAVFEEALLGQVVRSFSAVLRGIGVACVLACAMIWLAGLSGWFDDSVKTVSALLHPLPGVAILPIFMIWFGLNENAIIAVIVHSVIWPLHANLRAGLSSIPEIYGQLSRGFGVTGWRRIVHITLPAILPHVLSGLRTGWARAWRALISVEMIFGAIGGGGGIGWFIFKNRAFGDVRGMFAGLIVVIIAGLAVEKGVFDTIETKTLRRWGLME